MYKTMEYGATIFTLKSGWSRDVIFMNKITINKYELIFEIIINKVIEFINDFIGL